MSELSLSLSYKRDSNSFVLNETGTADGWVPAPVSVSPESLTVLNTNQLLEKFGGSNQSRIYVDGTNPSSTDVRNNSGNSPLRPFRTLQRALLEVSRRSFKLGSDNDLYEKTTIIVAPGEYEIYNGPANRVDEFTTFNRYQDASRLILKNTDWIIDGAYNAMSADFRAALELANEDDDVKQKLIFFLNALYNDLSRGNNQRTIDEALEMILKSSTVSCVDSPSYFAPYYVDSNLRNQYVNALEVMKTRAVAAMRNLGGIYVDNTISPDLDINGNPVDPPCADVADTIHTLLDYLIDTLDCVIDPRNIVLTSKGAEASVFPPDYEPPLTFYQKFNSGEQSGVILPRGVSIIGEDLRKVTFRPNYVPPKDGSEGRGSIFRMTGGNFFSGFTIRDKQGLEESHHNLSSFEFCTPADLSDYYTKVNTSFRDYSIYYHAINSAYLLDKNREWITKKSLETFFSAATNERFYNILQEETSLFVSALVRDLLTQSQTAVQEYSERFRLAHIYSLEISDPPTPQEDIDSALSLYENYFQRVIIYVQQSYLNQANITEGGYQDNRIKQSSDTTAVYNQETIVGRYADITAAVYTYRDIFLAIINSQPLPTYEIATRFEASDIEAITEETSIVTDPFSKPNSVAGASPYIFSASVRSEYGMCGIDADGSKVDGLKSILVAQFTIISLQKDSAAFTTLDSVGEVSGRYIGSKYTDTTDYRHYGYRVSNGAYAQLVSCFCIGPALHYTTESGGEVSISNSTSNFGDISLYSTGANSTAYRQDRGHRIYGIKKPAPINTIVRNFILGYVSSTSLVDQAEQTGTITLNSVAELSGYNVTNPSSPTKVYVRVNQILPTVRTIIISAEIISIQTNEQNKSVITVKFKDDYDTHWTNNIASSNYKPGLIGGALYFERYVDTRLDDDKLYKFLVQVPNPTVNSPKRTPVVNYILKKSGNSELFGSNWNSVFNRGNLFSLVEIKKHTSELGAEDFENSEYDPDGGELYECTFVSAYSNQSGRIEYYQDLIQSSSLDTVLDKDPNPNTYLNDLNSLDHKSRSVTRQILGMLLGYVTSEDFASLDSSLNIDESPLRRIHALDSVQVIDFHKPSIIRASGQTWEYCGYNNYSTALPALQTKKLGDGIENAQDRSRFLFSKIQTQVYAGRVYATGMDEEGNQYVGNTILDIKTGEETKINLGSDTSGEIEVIANFNTLTARLLTVQEEADIFNLQVTNDLIIGGSLTATEPVYLQDIISEGSVTIEQSLEVDGFTDLAGFLFYKDSNNKPTLSLSEENQSNIVLNNDPVLSAESGLTLSVGTTTVLDYDDSLEQVKLNTHSLSIANNLVLKERPESDINLNVNSLSISGSDVITENDGIVSASFNEIRTDVINAPNGIIISAGTDLLEPNNTKLLEVDGDGNIVFNRIAGQLSYVTTTIVSDTAPIIRPDNTALLEGDIWVKLSDPTRHFIYYKDDNTTPVEYFWVQL